MSFLRHILLIVATLLGSVTQAQDLGHLLRQTLSFDERYPRETVWLHTDNAAYLQGDTLWYKAYVVRASSLKPDSALSRVLYVELLNDAGTILQHSVVRLDSLGQGYGNFALTPPLQSGFYEIRAFTRAMSNWIDPHSVRRAGYYSRVFPLFAVDSKILAGDFSHLDIQRPESEVDFRLPHERPYDFGSAAERQLTFYPEGGRIALGTVAHIAYRLIDGKGLPVADSINVFSAQGERLCQSVSSAEGMGTFVLPPVASGAYAQVASSSARYSLPALSADAVALHAYEGADDETGEDVLNVELQPAAAMLSPSSADGAAPLRAALVVFSRERPYKVYPLELADEVTTLVIPLAELRAGVNRLEVIDSQARSLASRLVFRSGEEGGSLSTAHVAVRQSAASYEAFEPIAIEVEVKSADGSPLSGVPLSVSVRDERGDLIFDRQTSLRSQLMLGDALEDYVPSLAAASPETIDLLLQVQGWLPVAMEQLCQPDSFCVRQPIESGPIIRGTLIKDNNRRLPMADTKVEMMMYNDRGHVLSSEALTDADGVFAMEAHDDFVGDFVAQFDVSNDKHCKLWSCLRLDQWFGPSPRRYDPREMNYERPAVAAARDGQGAAGASDAAPSDDVAPSLQTLSDASSAPELFEWPDTIPSNRRLVLGEATVKAKKRFRFELIGQEFDRYSYGGGEAQSIRHSDTYFNVDLELQRLRDSGSGPVSVADFLAYLLGDKDRSRNKDQLTSGADLSALLREVAPEQIADTVAEIESDVELGAIPEQMSVKGLRYYVVVNNHSDMPVNMKNMQIAEQLKSVIVSYDASWATQLWHRYHPASDEHFDGIIYVHTRADWYKFKRQKGVEKRILHGYTRPDTFRGPDYRRIDAEDENDYRRTLYWNPALTTDAEGRATAIFYANARWSQRLRVSVRGITADGIVIDYDR